MKTATNWDYSKLEVVDGKAAQVAYDQMIFGNLPENERFEKRAQLLKYCAQDTLAMVELVKWIYANAK